MNLMQQFFDCSLSLKTTSPAATCTGRMLLLPVEGSGGLEWKIWVLSTRLESLDAHPEDETLLRTPSTLADGGDDMKTDVFIIGGGNGYAVCLSFSHEHLKTDLSTYSIIVL